MNLLIKREMNKQKEAEDSVLANVIKKTALIRERYVAQMDGKKCFEPQSYAEGKLNFYSFSLSAITKFLPESL